MEYARTIWLKEKRIPTTNPSLAKLDGQLVMLMDRYAASSRSPEAQQYVTDLTIQRLEEIDRSMEMQGIGVGDRQYLIKKEDGDLVVNDPFQVGYGPFPYTEDAQYLRVFHEMNGLRR
jgi:hypothetical protein